MPAEVAGREALGVDVEAGAAVLPWKELLGVDVVAGAALGLWL